MEEKKFQISTYLQTQIKPFIEPLMQQLAQNKPTDLLLFTKQYIEKLMSQRSNQKMCTDTEQSEEDQQERNLKFQEKLKQKKNNKQISRQGISAQVYGMYNKKQEYVHKVIKKSHQIKNTIRGLLKKSVLFGALTDQDINIVIDAMSVENYAKGDEVIKEGDQGLTLYVVGSGEYDCSKVIKGTQTFLKTYKTGQSFGELALLYTAPRAATIVCSKVGVLYGLNRQTFKTVVKQATNKRRLKFRSILSKVSILSEIDPYEREQLCDILKQESYKAGQYIVKQGEQGNKFYIIAEGKLIAEKESKKVFQFKQGDYFGEISLVRNTPRQASVKCITAAKVVYIDRLTFKRMFGPVEQILKRNEQKYKHYISD